MLVCRHREASSAVWPDVLLHKASRAGHMLVEFGINNIGKLHDLATLFASRSCVYFGAAFRPQTQKPGLAWPFLFFAKETKKKQSRPLLSPSSLSLSCFLIQFHILQPSSNVLSFSFPCPCVCPVSLPPSTHPVPCYYVLYFVQYMAPLAKKRRLLQI